MLKSYIFDTYSCIFIVVVISFTNTISEVFPQRHFADVNDAISIMHTDDANEMKASFLNSSHKNSTKWVVPYFNSSDNNGITFCRNQQVIRVPVSKHSDITTIPCYTLYASFRNGTDMLLYKGSPETNLTRISGNDMQQHRILEYITDSGFRYNFSGDWPKNESETFERWNYTCFFAKSNAKHYVIVELYRDDNSAIVSSKDCNPKYSVNETGRFVCKAPGNVNTTEFEWAYRTVGGTDTVFNSKIKKKKNSYDGTVAEEVRLKLRNSNIIGIACRANNSDSNITFQGLLNIYVKAKDIKIPEVLDNQTVELDDEPGLQLNCSFRADDSGSTNVTWLQDGSPMTDISTHHNWTTSIRTTTLKGLKSIYPLTSTNYTCAVSNYLGVSSKSFIVTRKNPIPVYMYALVSIVPFVLLTLIFTYFEWKRRKNAVMTDYKKLLKSLKEKDPANSYSIDFAEDSKKWKFLARGAYGEVWKTEIVHPDSGEKQTFAVKTFTWPPFLRIKHVKLRFDDLINEIRISQELCGISNIVSYVGFYAPEVHSFNVYLVLDYCDQQLEKFVYQHNQDETFVDDIDTIGRKRILSMEGNETLKTSHLMKYGQQIAEAMTYLHDKKIVHRDLAMRNILLKTLGDDIYALLADFGMSRFLRECSDSYIIQDDIPKERNIPLFWYPPESIGFDNKVEYTKKSDVWSFGVLLWEMFSRGSEPNLSYGVTGDTNADINLRQKLLNGTRLEKDFLYNTPEEIWLLMERCWSLNPEDRPDFSVISQTLKDINSSFGLYNEEVASAAESLNQEVCNETMDDNLGNVNAIIVPLDINASEVITQHADADTIELNDLRVEVENHGDFNTDSENVKSDGTINSDSKQQELSIPHQSIQNSDEVCLNMGRNNATFRNKYSLHSLQVKD